MAGLPEVVPPSPTPKYWPESVVLKVSAARESGENPKSGNACAVAGLFRFDLTFLPKPLASSVLYDADMMYRVGFLAI